jgi:tetratricopeptide (TPR) repeat protein
MTDDPKKTDSINPSGSDNISVEIPDDDAVDDMFSGIQNPTEEPETETAPDSSQSKTGEQDLPQGMPPPYDPVGDTPDAPEESKSAEDIPIESPTEDTPVEESPAEEKAPTDDITFEEESVPPSPYSLDDTPESVEISTIDADVVPEPPKPKEEVPAEPTATTETTTDKPATFEVEVLDDSAQEPLPAPGSAGSSPAPFDPNQTKIWQALLNEYEREIKAIGEVPAAAIFYYESGKIWEEKLAQPRNAWECYNQAFQLQPTLIPNIRAAERLATQVGNWSVAVQILESEIEVTDDPEYKAHLCHRRGRILEEKLGHIEEARSAYDSAIALSPDNIELLKQQERLSISMGEWKTVIDIRKQLLGLLKDPALVVQLFLGSAKIYQDRLGEPENSERLLKHVLEIEPHNLTALQSLRRIYLASQRFEAALETLKIEAQITKNPSLAAWLHYQAAQILREQLGDRDAAIDELQKALTISPNNNMALAELANILENLMRWQELVEILSKQAAVITDRQELVSIHFKLGEIWEDKLFSEQEAVSSYQKVIESNPNYTPALQALGRIYYRKGMWNELAQMYEIEIKETNQDKPKAIKLYKLAEILEERLDKDEESIQKLEQCLELNRGYLPALKALGRLYTKYNRWEALIQMYEYELANTSDKDQIIFLLDKIGTLWEDKLGNFDKSIETYQRLLDEVPNNLPAIRTLGKLYPRAARWEELIRINDLESQLVGDQKQVVSLLHRNAEVYEEKLNDKDTAIEIYQKVLSLAPNYLPALQALGRLYFVKGRWNDLIKMNYQEIEVSQNEDQKVNLLFKIGELFEEKLVQEDDAVEAYREVLRLRPNYFPAMKALIRITESKRDWEGLIDIYKMEADSLEDPQQKVLSLFRMVEILENNLHQIERAIETLYSILDIVDDHMPTIRYLARLLTMNQDWGRLLEIYKKALETTTSDSQKVEILFNIAEIQSRHINDLSVAAEYYEKILKIKPDHLIAIEALERIYLSQRNYSALVSVYGSLINSVKDPLFQLSLHSQIADIKENRLQPSQNAGDNHLQVLSLRPNHPEAIRSLDILYHRFGTWKGLRLLYEQELRQAKSKDEAIDLCVKIGDLAETRLDSLELAAHYYNEALKISQDYLPAIKALKRVYTALGDHQNMIALLDREGQVSRDPHQAISSLLEAAQVYRDRFNDPEKAVDCFFKVLEKDPKESQSFSQLEELLLQQSSWEKLAVLYQNKISVSEDDTQLGSLHSKLAGLFGQKLSRPRDAAEHYRKALQLNPKNQEAISALAQIAFEIGNWDESIQLSNQLIDLTIDPQIQAVCHTRLGIVFQEKKPNLEQATDHFKKVLQFTPGDCAALQRLKTIYVASMQWSEAVDSLQQLIEADRQSENLKDYFLELATIYETHLDQPDKAVEAYQKIQQADPTDVSIIQKLGQLYERLERWQELIDSYHSFIRLLPENNKADAIPLHMKMGGLYTNKQNNTDKAILEYKHVVQLDPHHEEAHQALADLYGKTEMYTANAAEQHRKLLQINTFNTNSLHELRRIFEEQRAFDKVFCVCALLHYLRAADKNEEFFYGENKNKVAESSDETLSVEEIEKSLVHPDEKGIIHSILRIIGAHLSKIYQPNLERHGVGKADKARPDDPFRALASNVALNIGPVDYEIFRSSQPNFLIAIENTSPPTMILGDSLVKRTSAKEQRFALGRSIKQLFDNSVFAYALDVTSLAQLIGAAVQPYFPNSALVTHAAGLSEDLSKRISKALPRKSRKELEELLQQNSDLLDQVPDYQKYKNGATHSANRFGLLMCNDIAMAIMHLSREITALSSQRLASTEEISNALGPHSHICELLQFSVSNEYARLRNRLKFSIVR